jgi:hypothetical protein
MSLAFPLRFPYAKQEHKKQKQRFRAEVLEGERWDFLCQVEKEVTIFIRVVKR